jgi:hypothetical protein
MIDNLLHAISKLGVCIWTIKEEIFLMRFEINVLQWKYINIFLARPPKRNTTDKTIIRNNIMWRYIIILSAIKEIIVGERLM